MNDYKFAKFININGKYKTYKNEKEIINLQDDEINKLQQKLNNIKFYIEQSDIKNMLWGKDLLEIIERD
jgi:hypothetical protein